MNFIYKLVESGTDQTEDIDLKRNIRFLNVAILISFINCLLFSIKNIYIHQFFAASLEVLAMLLILLAYFINRIKFQLAFLIALLVLELLFFVVSVLIFPGQGVELFFVFMAASIHVFFKKAMWPVIFFLVNLLLYFSPQLIFNTYQEGFFNYLVPISVFTAFFFLFRFFKLQSEAYEKQLNKLNAQLLNDKSLIEKQTEVLMRMDEEKNHFFENVSHEFRIPLTLISGWSDDLLNEPTISNTQTEKLQKIYNNAERLGDMVDEILRLSSVKKVDIKLVKAPIYVRQFFNRQADMFQFLAAKKEINILINCKDDKLVLMADEKKMDLIFSNLLSNAIKFSKAGGEISMTSRVERNELILEVIDTGFGIDKEKLPYIFSRYISERISENPRGSGIGLALVKEAVEEHNGQIEVTSTSGHGTKFTLKFPVEIIANDKFYYTHAYSQIEQTGYHNVQSSTILLVDDNTELLEYYIEIIKGMDLNYLTASSGAEALEKMQSQKVDLIVTDYVMPVMDGRTFLEKIKMEEQYQWIPIIFLTAKDDLKEKVNILEMGADDYLLKPFDRKELIFRILNLLKRYENMSGYNFQQGISPESVTENKEFLIRLDNILIKYLNDLNLSIPQIAEEINYTERSLYRKIKSITGLTPNEYVREYRLQYARKLLENKSYATLKQVAYEIGISTTSYFVKIYEARFGKHPSSY